MSQPATASLDPWLADLMIVAGASHSSGERRALSRDVERGLWVRIGTGAYAAKHEFDATDEDARHIVRMRALAGTSPEPPVFSHWSAAVVLGLPVLRPRLVRLHLSVPGEIQRHRVGIAHHVFPVHRTEVESRRGLLVTAVGRTVVDIAGAAPLERG